MARRGLLFFSCIHTTTTETSLLRNRDGDSDYQMKIAELFMVAQYYGALYLASILYSIDFILYQSVFYIAHICFFSGICLYRMWSYDSTGHGIATQEGFQNHGNWCYVT